MNLRWRQALGVAVISGLLLCFALVPAASADVNDFTVTRFASDQTLTNSDKQGQLHIVERINVAFTDYNHGILRAIPTSYKKHQLQVHVNRVSSDSGAPTLYTTTNENSNLVLKIGDANRTITGRQEYTIDYTVRNVISFYPDHDELYWDVNGNQWQQRFLSVSTTLHLPQGLRLSAATPQCYVGSYGSTDQHCSIAASDNARTLEAKSLRVLSPTETLTTVVGFQKGYFAPSTIIDTLGEYSAGAVAFFVPFILLAVPAGIYWYKRGRDPKNRTTIVPEYEAPDGLKPIEVGTVLDFKTDNSDITATIIDLAIRGYVKIIEENKKRLLLGHKLVYTFELRNADTTGLTTYELTLLQAIFGVGYAAGQQVDATQLPMLAKETTTIRTQVSDGLVEKGYFRSNPFTLLTTYHGFAIGALVILAFGMGVIHVGAPAWIGLAAGAAVAFLFLHFVPSRTLKGVEAKRRILGLKLFLQVTETERLKQMQAPNAPYAANAHQPVKTVELFEKLLPYAMVLGVENEWAKQFEKLYTTPPDWYSGNWTTFNAVYLASSLSGPLSTTVTTAFTPSGNSSSSGFGGGGGFSGGGGGGGGGGGW